MKGPNEYAANKTTTTNKNYQQQEEKQRKQKSHRNERANEVKKKYMERESEWDRWIEPWNRTVTQVQ